MIEKIANIMFTQETIIISIKWFTIIIACLGVVVGLLINFYPDKFREINKKLNHWYSTRKSLKPFEIMRDTDSHIYKYNKFWGIAMIAGSGLFLYNYFTWQLPDGALSLVIPNQVLTVLADTILVSMGLFLTVFILAGLPVWILLIVNPALLMRISEVFNHWYSTRLLILPMVKMHYEVDNLILKYNRMFGIIFVFGSAYILFTFWVYY